MRTFHNIDLIEKVKANPFNFLGQREFKLVQSFLMPIEGATEPKISDKAISKAMSYPSMREHIVDKYDFFDTKYTVQWTWAIGFQVENQQELLDRYFDSIFEYEELYPIDRKNYEINCIAKSNLDITNTIRILCEKPYLFGTSSLAEIRAYIEGHFWLKANYNLELTKNEKRLIVFINHWRNKTNETLKFDTWERVIMKDRMNVSPFTFSDQTNNGWVLKRFLEILEEDGIEIAPIKYGGE